jgi:FO synthase
MHAVSRIMLYGWIDNIQVSWTKLGSQRAQSILSRGVNDFGGTLMNESISRAAGSENGQEITAFEIVKMIRAAGRVPVRRNTLYETKEVYKDHDPIEIEPLVERKGYDPLSFLEMFPENNSNMGKPQDE